MRDAPAYFHRRVQADPKDTWALQSRGEGWLQKGEPDNAIQDFNECIRLDPTDSNAFNDRGRAWSDKKEYDKAIKDYDEAIRLDPKFVLAFNNRGIAWSDKKKYDKAIKDYDEAIRLDPNYALAFGNRGIVWYYKKEYDKAIKDYDEAIRLNPKDANTHHNRSVALMITRRKEAVTGFQVVLDLDGWKGDLAPYAVLLGNFAARLVGDEAAALRFLKDSAGKLDEAWPYPAVKFLRGEIDEVALLKKASDNDMRTEAHCFLGLDHALKGRKDKALAHYRWVKEHGNVAFTEYKISLAELERLERSAEESRR